MKNYIYGKNSCRNALQRNQTIKNVLLCDGFRDEEILKLLRQKKFNYQFITAKKMDELVGKVNHQGIAVEINDYEYYELSDLLKELESKEYPCIAMLDGIEDPHNFGAIIRSGDAFGIDGYIICKNRQVGLTNTVAHVSTGAIEYAKVAKVTNLNRAIEELKEKGYWIVASDGLAKQSYRDIDYKMKTCVIIGSEGRGISESIKKNSDFLTKIPMVGHVNSLNASVAAALYFSAIQESRSK